MSKKKILVVGPVLTSSGYGAHSRMVCKHLIKNADYDVQIVPTRWGDTPWLLNREDKEGLIVEIMKRTINPQGVLNADLSVQIQLPNEWNPRLAKVNVGVTAAVETDRSHPSWLDCCNQMSAVIFPSQHAKKSIEFNGKLTVPSYVIAETYTPQLIETETDDTFLSKVTTPFNFLLFGQITGVNAESDRKNLFYTLRWLSQTFANDNDVGIILKTNIGKNSTIDKAMCTNLLNSMLSEIGKHPKVFLVHGEMNDSEVAKLYKDPKVKALISLTRGEGFGLPMLEAATVGLPVITTGWSAHTEFLSLGRYISIDYQIEPVHQSRIDGKIFIPGSRWAKPIEQDFKKKVLKFRHNNEIPNEWAKNLSKTLIETHSEKSVDSSYEDVFNTLLSKSC